MELTHINEQGRAKMLDVSQKKETIREAVAYGCVYMKSETLQRIKEGAIKKGDVLSLAQVAGIETTIYTGHLQIGITTY